MFVSVRYWWVSQNKTFNHEVGGGYLWSPQVNNKGTRVAAYDFMTEIEPGDIVFSFAGTYIRAIGIATGRAYESAKPEVFGKSGVVWSDIGWRVPIEFVRLDAPLRPANHMHILEPLLPQKYSPVRPDGVGNQQYLFPVPDEMAQALLTLTGQPDLPTVGELTANLDAMSLGYDDQEIIVQAQISDTDKAQLVLARRGQGVFRHRVRAFEPVCRVTGVAAEHLLIASHIKPWKEATHQERLDGNNGLFLSPHIDKLFDGGFVSFTHKGRMLVSSQLDPTVLPKWSIEPSRDYGGFNPLQEHFLEHHRESVLKA